MKTPQLERWCVCWGIVAILVILDQLSKLAVLFWIAPAERISLFPGLALTHVYNHGAAFSFLHDAGGWQRYFFVFLALAVCAYLVYWLYQLPRQQVWMALGLILILGGALGNLIDRLIYGYVIDFVLVYAGDWSFPVFNVADSAISVGATLIVILMLFSSETRKQVL